MLYEIIKRNKYLLPSLALLLLLTLFPGNGKVAGNYLDKVAHALFFFLFAINAIYAFPEKEQKITIILICIFLALLTEITQQYIPGRNFEYYDLIADMTGSLFAVYLMKQKSKAINNLMKRIGA